jgi:hypothetical protein
VKLKKAKVPSAASVSDEADKLRAKLKELKDVVLVDEDGINGMGDKPTSSLLQAYWASGTGNRRVIPLDVINKFVEDNAKGAAKDNVTSSEGDNVKRAAKGNATYNRKEKTSIKAKESNDTTSSKANWAKLAKLVKMAKSMDLWCLMLYVLLMQEAKAKQRKVCPVNLRGRCAQLTTAATNTQKSASCPTTARERSQRPRVRCGTCGSSSEAKPRETSPEGGAAPTLPGSKGSNSSKCKVLPSQPDMNLVKLDATAKAEELKTRIRAAKMMSQGVTYSRVVE